MKRSVAGISLKDGKYFIARRLPGGDMGGKWEFPGGKLEEGEECREALEREYLEEFGVAIRVTMFIAEAVFRHEGKEFLLSAYWIELPEPLEGIRLSEHSEWRWASFDEILTLDFADSDRKILPFLI